MGRANNLINVRRDIMAGAESNSLPILFGVYSRVSWHGTQEREAKRPYEIVISSSVIFIPAVVQYHKAT